LDRKLRRKLIALVADKYKIDILISIPLLQTLYIHLNVAFLFPYDARRVVIHLIIGSVM
jgi:hypothetical protein